MCAYFRKNTDGELNGLGKKIEQLIVNMKVLTKYNYKCYTISEVAWDMHPDSRFWSSGQLVRYKLHLKFVSTYYVKII